MHHSWIFVMKYNLFFKWHSIIILITLYALSVDIALPNTIPTIGRHQSTGEWQKIQLVNSLNLTKIWGTSVNHVLMITSQSIIQYNGQTSTIDHELTHNTLKNIWGDAQNNVFCVGDGGLILRYNGTTWSQMLSPTNRTIMSIWGMSSSQIYAAGASGIIIYYNGLQWQSLTSPTTDMIMDISGISDQFIMGVTYSGKIIQFNGETWKQMPDTSSQTLYGIWVRSNQLAVAVGANGTILMYNGTNWLSVPSGTTQTLTDVWGRSESDIFAVGAQGVILHFDGITWQALNSNTSQSLWGIWGAIGGDVYVVGSSGTLLHTTPMVLNIPDQIIDEDYIISNLYFSVDDLETPANQLIVSAKSTNPTLLPDHAIQIIGTGAEKGLTLSPIQNTYGTATIHLTVWDASGLTGTTSFHVTVNPINDCPTVDPISDLFIAGNAHIQSVYRPLADVDNSNLTVTFSSNAPHVYTQNTIMFDSGAMSSPGFLTTQCASPCVVPLTMSFYPVVSFPQSADITLTVSDGICDTHQPFHVYYIPENHSPGIGDEHALHIQDIEVAEDVQNIALPISVWDNDPFSENLLINVVSSNLSLLPQSEISIEGQGLTRMVRFTPLPDQSGVTTLSLMVTDPFGLTAMDSLTISITAMNDAPVIHATLSQYTDEDTPIVFSNASNNPIMIQDIDALSMPMSVTLIAENGSLSFSHMDALIFFSDNHQESLLFGTIQQINKTLDGIRFTPFDDGIGHLEIDVSDHGNTGQGGELTSSADITIHSEYINHAPRIYPPHDVITWEDTPCDPIAFTVVELDGEAYSVWVQSGDSNLIASHQLTLTHTASTYIIAITPNLNAYGETDIMIMASDFSGLTSMSLFHVSITPQNDPPIISHIPAFVTREDFPTIDIDFMISDIESEAHELSLSVLSSDTTVISYPNIHLSGSDESRRLSIAPATHQFGESMITLILSDPEGLTASVDFMVYVASVNDPPFISSIPDQIIDEDSMALSVSFHISDIESQPQDLTLSVDTSDPLIVNYTGLELTGTGNDRLLTCTVLPNAYGDVTLTVFVSDPDGATVTSSFKIHVNPMNDPPILSPIQHIIIQEDDITDVVIHINDPDADWLTLTVQTSNMTILPSYQVFFSGHEAHYGQNSWQVLSAKASITTLTMTIIPATNQWGTAIISLFVSDPFGFTQTQSFGVIIREVNDPPVILPISMQFTDEDIPDYTFPVTVVDAENDPFLFYVTSLSTDIISNSPQSIQISGSDQQRLVTVTPLPDKNGIALLELMAEDMDGITVTRRVVITFRPVNDPPIGINSKIITFEDTATYGILSAQDIDDVQFRYEIINQPQLGKNTTGDVQLLSASSGMYIYTPAIDNIELDYIYFKVYDTHDLGSEIAEVMVSITPMNDPPQANDKHVFVIEDTETAIELPSFDIDGDTLIHTIIDPPKNGVVEFKSVTPTVCHYLPKLDYYGPDGFSYRVDDGQYISEPAWITITVLEGNDPPIAFPGSLTVVEDNCVLGRVFGSDQDIGDVIQFQIWKNPEKGTLAMDTVTGNIAYTPYLNAFGPDAFQFVSVDTSQAFSEPATISIMIMPVNDIPIVYIKHIIVNEDESTFGHLTCFDPDQEPLTFELLQQGIIGNFTITNTSTGAFSYTPYTNLNGHEMLTYRVVDPVSASEPAFISITINPINDPPVAMSGYLTVVEDTPTQYQMQGWDPDGDLLYYVGGYDVQFGETLVVDAIAGILQYTPELNRDTYDSFTIEVFDGQVRSKEPGHITVIYIPVNDEPYMFPIGDHQTYEDTQSIPFSILISDVEDKESDMIVTGMSSNQRIVPDENILFLGSDAQRYIRLTPLPNRNGMVTIAVTATDTEGAYTTRTFNFTVVPVNDMPLISVLPNQLMNENAPPQSVDFTALEYDNDIIECIAESSNQLLLPNHRITIHENQRSGAGYLTLTMTAELKKDLSITINPNPDQYGMALVRVMLRDYEFRNFSILELMVNSPPEINVVEFGKWERIPNIPLGKLFLDVWGTQWNDVFVVGDIGQIFHFNGIQWDPMVSPTTNYLKSMWGDSSDHVIAVGSSRKILTYNGQDWQTLDSEISDPIFRGVWGHNRQDVFAVGYEGKIFHYNGQAWNALPTNLSVNMLSVWGYLGIAAYAVGDMGTIVTQPFRFEKDYMQYPWQRMPVASKSFLLSVWGNTRYDIHACGNEGRLFNYNGYQWQELTSGVTFDLQDIWGYSAGNVFCAGRFGTILHYDGEAWHQIQSNTSVHLNSLWGINRKEIYAVGESSTIMRMPILYYPLPDLTTQEDTPFTPVTICIDDVETSPLSLPLTIISSNPSLISSKTIQIDGNGSRRTLRMTPALHQFGTATVTLLTSDIRALTAIQSFQITVTALDDIPEISHINDITVVNGRTIDPIALTLIDADGGALTVSISSSNPVLLPDTHIVLNSALLQKKGKQYIVNAFPSQPILCNLIVTPITGIFDSTHVTLSVVDEQNWVGESSFRLTIKLKNAYPEISPLYNHTIYEDMQSDQILFSVTDEETGSLSVTVVSLQPDIIPNTSDTIQLIQMGSDYVLTVRPAINQFGLATLRVTALDQDQGITHSIFTVQVLPENDAPQLLAGHDILFPSINEDELPQMGVSLSDLLSQCIIADSDTAPVTAIAVIGVDQRLGIWQYSINNGVTWIRISKITGKDINLSTQSLLLDATFIRRETQRIRFIPLADKNGIATLRFRLWDKTNHTVLDTVSTTTNGYTSAFSAEIGIVSIDILPINDAPIAHDITFTTSEDIPFFGQMSGNDIDMDVLTYSVVTMPALGTLHEISTSGAFLYTPFLNVYGTDKFSYYVMDSEYSSDVVTAWINITPINDKPVAIIVGDNMIIHERALIQLDGSPSYDPDHDILSYIWNQSIGPSVSLQYTNNMIASFIAPEIQPISSTTLSFTLTVMDPYALTSESYIQYTVIDIPIQCDMNGSKTIDLGDAILLGMVISDPSNSMIIKPIDCSLSLEDMVRVLQIISEF